VKIQNHPVQQQMLTNTFRNSTCDILRLRVVRWAPCWASVVTTVHNKPKFDSHCRSTELLTVLFILHFSLPEFLPSYLIRGGGMAEALRWKCNSSRGVHAIFQ